MKRCREFRARIPDALLGRLPIESVFDLEEHVRVCAACRAEYEREQALDAALARIPEPPVGRIDLDRAVARVRAAIEDEALPARRRSWLPLALAASAAAALVLALLRSHPDSEPAPRAEPELVREEVRPDTFDSPASAIDPARLAQARDEVRCLLSSAAANLPAVGDPASAAGFAAAFDTGARELESSKWPVLRLVEGALDDPDPAVARAALRYIGARADRLSVRTLESAFSRSDTRVDAALALCDAGDIALEALAPALRDSNTRAVVLSRLAARGGETAARLMETSVRETNRTETAPERSARVRESLQALASVGPAAVPSLLRLGSDGTLAPHECLDALAQTEGAPEVVADFVLSRPRGIGDGLVLVTLSALQPARALPLLERRCLDVRDRRPEVLECIALYGGEEGLGTLLRLASSGRIAPLDLEQPILDALARDRMAGAAVVREATRAGRRVELQVFHDFLLAHAGPACAPALVAFGECETLPASDRRWAVLLAGETGVAADADLLAELFWRSKPSERELRAACLIAIRTLAGVERVERVVEGLPPKSSRRLIALLADGDARSRPVSTLVRLARELEIALATNAP